MSQLKLQKLLYYIQAWHLVGLDSPLFQEDFQAWVHGPALRSVWDEYKSQSQLNAHLEQSATTGETEKAFASVLHEDQIDLINDVLTEYGQRSGYHLECLTHSELPWTEARAGMSPDEFSDRPIKKESMKKFYSSLLAAQNGQEVHAS